MSSPYFIGIDIGGTKMAVSIFDVTTSSVERVERFPSGADCDPAEMVERMVAVARGWIDAKGTAPEAVGVSVGAVYDWASGCVTDAPHLPNWKGFPVVATFKEAFGVPVFAENDANACALAEWRYGAGRGCDHVIFLTFGTGLGAGLILNGRLYRGASGLAGEVGAMRVADSGPAVRDKPGCLEGFASGAGIAQLAAAARAHNQETTLPENPTAKDVFSAAGEGDAVALAVVEESTVKLGQGLATLLDVLSPDRIVLGSIFVRAESMIRPLLEETLRHEAMAETNAACQIVPAELGESIGNFGAATLAELGLAGEL
ncbi:MAG: ROK family protein [Opitutaceae bacterium]|jgi:glucokinase|nr:ROK family protein [Opitutaceae bacterium]